MNDKFVSLFTMLTLVFSSTLFAIAPTIPSKNTMSPLANERFSPTQQKSKPTNQDKSTKRTTPGTALYQGGHNSSTSLYHGNSSSSLYSGSSSSGVRKSPPTSPPPVKSSPIKGY